MVKVKNEIIDFTPLNVVYGNNHFEHANYYYKDLNVLNNYNDELISLKNGFKKLMKNLMKLNVETKKKG
jgi:hypothetical protein